MNTLIIIIYSIIFILILHFLIKHMLLREKIYRKVRFVKKENSGYSQENDLPKIDTEENFISECKSTNNLDFVKNEIDNNMEKQLTDYLTYNEDIYKQKTDIYLDTNKEEITPGANKFNDISPADFQSQDIGLDKYYEKVVDIHKEIKVPPQSFPKEKEIKEPDFNLNNENNVPSKNSDTLWEYKDENIMNGGEINGGLFGWDSSTNTPYASLDDQNTILPCSNN